MITLTDRQARVEEILKAHMHFLEQDCGNWKSMRANLDGADLSHLNLSNVCLGYASLRGANLKHCNLRFSNLHHADLREACFIGAILNNAVLTGANLCYANLNDSDLYHTDLRYADLRGALMEDANIDNAILNFPIACPTDGSFIGWKKAYGFIVKLLIPDDAKRSSGTGRKCRCSKATCISIEHYDGRKADIDSVPSLYDQTFIYTVGKTVEVPNFDENRFNECAPGIHFFISRDEAVNY